MKSTQRIGSATHKRGARFLMPHRLLPTALLMLVLLVTGCSLGDLATIAFEITEKWDIGTVPTADVLLQGSLPFEGDEPEHWLLISITYTGSCYPGIFDPCEQLANDLAQIAVENYSEVDTLTGVRINIWAAPDDPAGDPSLLLFERAQSAEAWRTAFSK